MRGFILGDQCAYSVSVCLQSARNHNREKLCTRAGLCAWRACGRAADEWVDIAKKIVTVACGLKVREFTFCFILDQNVTWHD